MEITFEMSLPIVLQVLKNLVLMEKLGSQMTVLVCLSFSLVLLLFLMSLCMMVVISM